MSIDKIRAAMNRAEGAVQAVGGVALLIAEYVPGAADIIAADLENANMSLGAAYKALEDYARKHAKRYCFACPVVGFDPENEVIRCIADFYKVPLDGTAAELETQALGGESDAPEAAVDELDLLSLL